MWNNVIDSFHHTVSHKPASGVDARLTAAAAAASTGAFLAMRI